MPVDDFISSNCIEQAPTAPRGPCSLHDSKDTPSAPSKCSHEDLYLCCPLVQNTNHFLPVHVQFQDSHSALGYSPYSGAGEHDQVQELDIHVQELRRRPLDAEAERGAPAASQSMDATHSPSEARAANGPEHRSGHAPSQGSWALRRAFRARRSAPCTCVDVQAPYQSQRDDTASRTHTDTRSDRRRADSNHHQSWQTARGGHPASRDFVRTLVRKGQGIWGRARKGAFPAVASFDPAFHTQSTLTK
jgi:hypothetical protein